MYSNTITTGIMSYLRGLSILAKEDDKVLKDLINLIIVQTVYDWAPDFSVSETAKIKMRNIIQCIFAKNPKLPFLNTSETVYTNVNLPQTLSTWQLITTPPNDDPADFIRWYYVTLIAGVGGLVQINSGIQEKEVSGFCSTSINIKAIASTGYTFNKWSDDNTTADRTYSAISDITLTALFTKNTE